MSLYQYQAVDLNGKKTKGTIVAGNDKEAKDKLRAQKVFVLSLNQKRRSFRTQDLKGVNLLNWTMQLTQLLQAGLPLYESLIALQRQSSEMGWHPILQGLSEKVKEGQSLSTGMSSYPGSFDPLYTAMINAGETTGSLPTVCSRLTHLLSRQIKLKKQIMGALLYPLLLASFAFCVILLLLTFVIPSIETLFEDRTLNGFTAFVIGTSHFIKKMGLPILLLVALGGGYLMWYLRLPKGKLLVANFSLKLPLLQGVLIKASLSRFCRAMATLQKGGVTLSDALYIGSRVLKSPPLEKIMRISQLNIVEGSSLSIELGKHSLIPSILVQMVHIGEETGDLSGMFEKIAELFEEEVERQLTRLTGLIQPLVLLSMGVIVGLVMLAVLLPLTDITSFTGL